MKRRIRIAVCMAVCCFLFMLPASALDITIDPTDRFFVNDFADVISEQDETAIYNMGVQLYERTKAQIVAVTIPTLDGADINEYGVALGRAWGVGDKDANTGIVLLLATEDRQATIAVGYGLEGAVTDAKSGILLDHYAIPYFSENEYSAGMRQTYNALINEVYLEFGLEADENYVPADELENDTPGWVVLLVFLGILLLSGFASRRGFPLFLFFGGPRFGGHSHNGSSGGFSGFRGGGGSFGGGGASRRF